MSLGATFTEAMRLAEKMREDGVPEVEICATLERTLRAAWPFTREWKYLCNECRDYGLRMATCPGDATCGRTKPHLPHDVGTWCWCAVGQARKPKAKTLEDAVDAAARTASSMRKLGR